MEATLCIKLLADWDTLRNELQYRENWIFHRLKQRHHGIFSEILHLKSSGL